MCLGLLDRVGWGGCSGVLGRSRPGCIVASKARPPQKGQGVFGSSIRVGAQSNLASPHVLQCSQNMCRLDRSSSVARASAQLLQRAPQSIFFVGAACQAVLLSLARWQTRRKPKSPARWIASLATTCANVGYGVCRCASHAWIVA